MNAAAIRAVRTRFGDLADPIIALRAAGRVVAPFGDGFRVNDQVVDAGELIALAERLAARQARVAADKRLPRTADRKAAGGEAGTTEKANGPGSVPAPIPASGTENDPELTDQPNGSAPPSDAVKPGISGDQPPASAPPETSPGEALAAPVVALCDCKRPKGHGGRCWVMRGSTAPTTVRKPAPVRTCAKCSGPRSASATSAFCRRCFLANRKPQGRTAQIVALQIDVAVLKAELAAERAARLAFEDNVKDGLRELLERIEGVGEGR